MNRPASASATSGTHRLVAALGLVISVAASCGDSEPTQEGPSSTGGTSASGGDGASGGTAGRGGTLGIGGETAGGEGGIAGEAGSPGADCVRDGDCVPLNTCYSASCRDGICGGSPLVRGSACGDGFCNGFGRCLPCLDDAPEAERDTGCSPESPVCPEGSSCVGCTEDAHCDDGIQCTVDRCMSSECENDPLDLGSACTGGFCTGTSNQDSCATCVDDAIAGFDRGCTPELPRCDTESTPPTCSGCQSSMDCYDDNECTSDECLQGVCERATLLSGTPCTFGYCNGIHGAENCVPRQCQTDPDCDDRAACTTEVCRAGFCDYTANDSQCSDSGDVCRPNVCMVGTGCQPVDVSRSRELLENGSLDLGNEGWVEESVSYDQVIYPYDYIPTLFPHTGTFVAYLGGGELLDETSSLSQTVAVPAGAVRLELSFFYQVWVTEPLPDDHNVMTVTLRATQTSQSDIPIFTLHNQDTTRVWTRFTTTIDATDWAGSDAVLEFRGSAIDGFTAFLVDSLSLEATVCE
jgi:hypothetical protein